MHFSLCISFFIFFSLEMLDKSAQVKLYFESLHMILIFILILVLLKRFDTHHLLSQHHEIEKLLGSTGTKLK